MLFFSLLLSSVSFANDSLDKKLFLLRRSIKKKDCNQASEMIEKLIVENPTYANFWKVLRFWWISVAFVGILLIINVTYGPGLMMQQ